jgi:peptidoglycan hydrolase-like amidase
MSQNGAKNMAAVGYTAEDILGFYYEGCTVQSIY